MKRNLRSEIEALKARPGLRDWRGLLGRIYDSIHEVDLSTAPLSPDQTQEEWEAFFIQREGTRDKYINKQMEARKQRR